MQNSFELLLWNMALSFLCLLSPFPIKCIYSKDLTREYGLKHKTATKHLILLFQIFLCHEGFCVQTCWVLLEEFDVIMLNCWVYEQVLFVLSLNYYNSILYFSCVYYMLFENLRIPCSLHCKHWRGSYVGMHGPVKLLLTHVMLWEGRGKCFLGGRVQSRQTPPFLSLMGGEIVAFSLGVGVSFV